MLDLVKNRRYAIAILVSFVCGVLVTVFAPALVRFAGNALFPATDTEVARISSPDGRVDAIAQTSNCGAPCSLEYTVSVVPKGAVRPTEVAQQTFMADDIVDPQLKWIQPHLLEISYKRAFIESFRNVVYPVARPGNLGSWKYSVEVRLSPTSAGFSYLTGTGN